MSKHDTTPADAADDAARAAAERARRDAGLAALLQRAAQGEAAAFEAFYDATIAPARALARRLVRPADLEDVLSEAYFQAWREVARFDAGRGSAATWLLTMVRSRAIDLWRRQRDDSAAPDPDEVLSDTAHPDPGPADLLAQAQAGSRLHGALADLSAAERWVIGLAYYREQSHSEIAVATGMPLGTVKSLIHRAQAKLRERLA